MLTAAIGTVLENYWKILAVKGTFLQLRKTSNNAEHYLFIHNQIVHGVQQSKKQQNKKKLLHSCQVIYNATNFIAQQPVSVSSMTQ